MKCKYCHKNVRSIAHFMQAHKSLMMRKMRAGRKHRPKDGKRSKRLKRELAHARGHYCPVCGKRH